MLLQNFYIWGSRDPAPYCPLCKYGQFGLDGSMDGTKQSSRTPSLLDITLVLGLYCFLGILNLISNIFFGFFWLFEPREVLSSKSCQSTSQKAIADKHTRTIFPKNPRAGRPVGFVYFLVEQVSEFNSTDLKLTTFFFLMSHMKLGLVLRLAVLGYTGSSM